MNKRWNEATGQASPDSARLPDPARLLDELHARANRLRESGHYAESESLFRRALEMAECLFDEDDVRLAPLLNNFAVLGKYSGNYDKLRRRLSDAR